MLSKVRNKRQGKSRVKKSTKPAAAVLNRRGGSQGRRGGHHARGCGKAKLG